MLEGKKNILFCINNKYLLYFCIKKYFVHSQIVVTSASKIHD